LSASRRKHGETPLASSSWPTTAPNQRKKRTMQATKKKSLRVENVLDRAASDKNAHLEKRKCAKDVVNNTQGLGFFAESLNCSLGQTKEEKIALKAGLGLLTESEGGDRFSRSRLRIDWLEPRGNERRTEGKKKRASPSSLSNRRKEAAQEERLWGRNCAAASSEIVPHAVGAKKRGGKEEPRERSIAPASYSPKRGRKRRDFSATGLRSDRKKRKKESSGLYTRQR